MMLRLKLGLQSQYRSSLRGMLYKVQLFDLDRNLASMVFERPMLDQSTRDLECKSDKLLNLQLRKT